MSLYKRGNIWWCEWQVNGKPVRETTRTTNRKEAQEYHDKRRAEIWRETKLGEKPAVKWDDAAVTWLTGHAIHKRSYETDRLRMRRVHRHLKGLTLPQITNDVLVKMRTAIISDGLSIATANRHLAIVSGVLRYAHASDSSQPLPKIPYLAENNERFIWLTKDQARALIARLPQHLSAMARLALSTGLRRSNVTGLLWKNIDIERRILWVWGEEAKGKKQIPVPLNNDAIDVLNAQPRTYDYVFHYRGLPIIETNTAAFKKACRDVGIDPEFTWHGLRHTWASWHVMAETPLEILQKLGGWSDMTMVLRYAHLAPGYIAGYVDNVSLTKLPTQQSIQAEESLETPEYMGWLTGLEPATTGITILPVKKKVA